MPSLPLFTSPTHPDGHHRVVAPGGFETWHFDARGSDGKVLFIVQFHQGWPLHPRYVRRYARYRAMPTRFRPPLPADFNSVTIELYEEGAPPLRCALDVPAGDFAASADQLKLRAGASHVESAAGDGSLHLRARGTCRGRTVNADLLFRPVFRAAHVLEIDAHDKLILCDPLHAVTGEFHVFDAAASAAAARIIRIEGAGYHEHRVGLRWPGDARTVLRSGRTLGVDFVTCYRANGAGPARAWDVRADRVDARELPRTSGDAALTRWRLPRELASLQVLSDTFSSATFADGGSTSAGGTVEAVIAPHRLAWPVAGMLLVRAPERG